VTQETWRYIDAGPRPGAENMAVDAALLYAHEAGLVPPTLRVYGWRPDCISLGKFQRVEATANLEACRASGVDIARRPTGGRAILHTAEEVTFSLVVSAARLGTTGVMDSYRHLAAGIVAALRALDLDARLVERTAPVPSGASQMMAQDPACFAVKARCDLVVGQAKLVGSAQVQHRGFILQQNSLPLSLHLDAWSRLFLRPALAPEAIGLWEAAGREVRYAEVAAALREGFAQAFGVRLEEGALTPEEARRAQELAPEVRVL
jgi:lipoate-protein ligase A